MVLGLSFLFLVVLWFIDQYMIVIDVEFSLPSLTEVEGNLFHVLYGCGHERLLCRILQPP